MKIFTYGIPDSTLVVMPVFANIQFCANMPKPLQEYSLRSISVSKSIRLPDLCGCLKTETMAKLDISHVA